MISNTPLSYTYDNLHPFVQTSGRCAFCTRARVYNANFRGSAHLRGAPSFSSGFYFARLLASLCQWSHPDAIMCKNHKIYLINWLICLVLRLFRWMSVFVGFLEDFGIVQAVLMDLTSRKLVVLQLTWIQLTSYSINPEVYCRFLSQSSVLEILVNSSTMLLISVMRLNSMRNCFWIFVLSQATLEQPIAHLMNVLCKHLDSIELCLDNPLGHLNFLAQRISDSQLIWLQLAKLWCLSIRDLLVHFHFVSHPKGWVIAYEVSNSLLYAFIL